MIPGKPARGQSAREQSDRTVASSGWVKRDPNLTTPRQIINLKLKRRHFMAQRALIHIGSPPCHKRSFALQDGVHMVVPRGSQARSRRLHLYGPAMIASRHCHCPLSWATRRCGAVLSGVVVLSRFSGYFGATWPSCRPALSMVAKSYWPFTVAEVRIPATGAA
jgi:hypothetical protein